MSSWHCIRLRACEADTFGGMKKVARRNWRSNLPRSRANTRSGHDAALGRGQEASSRPHDRGSRKTDAVQDSSATAALKPGLIIVELRAGLGHHFGDRLLLKGRCGSALACLELRLCCFSDYFFCRGEDFS
jgi:hypothetical protein